MGLWSHGHHVIAAVIVVVIVDHNNTRCTRRCFGCGFGRGFRCHGWLLLACDEINNDNNNDDNNNASNNATNDVPGDLRKAWDINSGAVPTATTRRARTGAEAGTLQILLVGTRDTGVLGVLFHFQPRETGAHSCACDS